MVILFDFDGTLVDTLPTVVDCLRRAWRAVMGTEAGEPSDRQLKRQIGKRLSTMMANLLVEQGGEAAPERVAALVNAYRRMYEPLAAQAQPFPGTVAMLQEMGRLGVRRGIVTNKRRALTLSLLQAVGMQADFDTVVAIEDVSSPKPAPDPIWLAAQRLEAPLTETVYVGDSEADIDAGRAAGVAAVALVPWGVLGQLEDVRALKIPGVVVLRDWQDLYGLLSRAQPHTGARTALR